MIKKERSREEIQRVREITDIFILKPANRKIREKEIERKRLNIYEKKTEAFTSFFFPFSAGSALCINSFL